MVRKLKLSWIGSLRQWKKVYKGQQHWLGTGKGKDDLTSYKIALEKWEAKKVEIDKAARMAADKSGYEQWRNQLAARDGVDPHVYLSGGKAPPSPPPTTEAEDVEALARISVMASTFPYDPKSEAADKDGKTMAQCIAGYLEKQKQRYEHGLQFPDAPPSKRIGGQRLIAYQNGAKLLSAIWKGQKVPPTEAGVAVLMMQFRDECERLLVAGAIQKGTYNERIKTLRHFIGWMHYHNIIESLPRQTEEICAKYKTKSSARAIDVPVVQKLFNTADDTLKTFIALAVNCGFNVGDIASFTEANVQGQYMRYDRNKTGVPIRYKLWPITQELLKKHQPGTSTYFETVDGDPLLVIDVDKKQRKSKIDNKFSALCSKLKITKVSFSNFRDTSSTWFESDPHHRHMADLFEAHKDSSMSVFYKDASKVDVDKLFAPLDAATDELEKYYGLNLA